MAWLREGAERGGRARHRAPEKGGRLRWHQASEFITPDLVAVVAEEAHKLGMGVTGHSWDAIASAKAGVDGVEHIWSVGYTSIRDLEKRRKLAFDRTEGRIDAEIAGAQYEVEGYDDVIKADGRAPCRLDADDRQMAAAALAERGPLLETRARRS